jgi:hypothetical protein
MLFALPFNTTGEVGVILEAMTTNVTGSVFLTLLAVVIVVMALAFAARIPIEWTALIIYPVILATATVTDEFLPVLGVLIFYSAVLLSKNFIIK